MINEANIFSDNIKKVRNYFSNKFGKKNDEPPTETPTTSGDPIINAIQNHEYLYIYYSGDDTIEKGYRTIRPYVLGTSTAGNKVLRAWQDKGKSDSLRADAPRKRHNHEYHTDVDGKQKAGWRLFRVDKISSVYPTGKKFIDNDGNVLIPPLYNEKDKQMTSIIASVSLKQKPEPQVKKSNNIDEPTVVDKQTNKSEFDRQATKLKQFHKEPTAKDIENLYNISKKVMKKSPDRYLVVKNDRGEFKLVDVSNEDKLKPEDIIGKLTNLYSKLVLHNRPMQPLEDKFIKQEKDKALKNMKNPVNTELNRKSFFKQ